jgi:hypothetical protein
MLVKEIKSQILNELEKTKSFRYKEEKIFLNTTLRLTYFGNKVMSEEFEYFQHTCNVRDLTPKHYRCFNELNVPYYISDKGFIIVYSSFHSLGMQLHDSVANYLNSLLY